MRTTSTIDILLVVLLLVSCLSCGLKTPPRLPREEPPPKLEDLKGAWEGREVVLTGRLAGSGETGGRHAAIPGARIYHAWYGPGEDPCEGCPISYSGYLEAVPEKGRRGVFACRVPLERDQGTHFFEVRLVGPGGAVGPGSDRIKIVVEE